MPTTIMNPSQVRETYEKQHRRIADSTWFKYLKSLKEMGLPVTIENLNVLRDVKKKYIYDIKIECAQQKDSLFTQKRELLMTKKSMTGGDFLDFLKNELQISPQSSTISRWFKVLNGFSKDRVYSSEQLEEILMSAIYYVKRHSNAN